LAGSSGSLGVLSGTTVSTVPAITGTVAFNGVGALSTLNRVYVFTTAIFNQFGTLVTAARLYVLDGNSDAEVTHIDIGNTTFNQNAVVPLTVDAVHQRIYVVNHDEGKLVVINALTNSKTDVSL